MEKFLKVTNAPVTGQLISINGIKAIGTANATSSDVTIDYFDGTTTTVITANQVGADVYEEILSAIQTAIATSWQKAYFEVVLPKAVTSILNA
jgi:hypothetical protein